MGIFYLEWTVPFDFLLKIPEILGKWKKTHKVKSQGFEVFKKTHLELITR